MEEDVEEEVEMNADDQSENSFYSLENNQEIIQTVKDQFQANILPPLKLSLDISNIKNPRVKKLIHENAVFLKFPVLNNQPAIRKDLPCGRKETFVGNLNLGEILRHNYGKDLSRITMPVWLNEPLSYVQKQGDQDQFHFLNLANREEDPFKRIGYIAAFQFLNMGRNYFRSHKPFNSLLGETFEYVCDDYKILVEQTSHHPPIHCFHIENDDFILYGFNNSKLSFNLSGVGINFIGDRFYYLKRTKELFRDVEFPRAELRNLLFG